MGRPQDLKSADAADAAAWAASLLLMVLTLAVMGRACGFEFVAWDDYENVAHNLRLNPPAAAGIASFWDWRHPYLALYIPLTYTVWGILAWVGQVQQPDAGLLLNPYVFHTANVVLHVLSVLVVFAILRMRVPHMWAAAAGAALFAIHPVQVEPVAWVTGMKDVLCGLLSLTAIWQFLKARRSTPGGVRHDVLATVAFVLALLAKPGAVVVPLIAWILAPAVSGGKTERRAWPWLLAWLVLGAALAALTVSFQGSAAVVAPVKFWQRPLVAGDALAFYMQKLIVPWPLGTDYGRTPAHALAAPWIYVVVLIPAAALALAFAARRRCPQAFSGSLVFFAALLPVLGLVGFDFQRFSTVADRYLYLPMLGVALAAAGGLAMIRKPALIAALTLPLLAVLAILSAVQVGIWQNSQTLFQHTLAVNPGSAVTWASMATLAVDAHQGAQAIDDCRQALRCNPDLPEGHATLGTALLLSGQVPQAIDELNTALRLSPHDLAVMDNLEVALAESGRPDEGMAVCRRAMALDADDAAAHRNLGTILANLGRWQEAQAELAEAVRINPRDAQAARYLAIARAHLR